MSKIGPEKVFGRARLAFGGTTSVEAKAGGQARPQR